MIYADIDKNVHQKLNMHFEIAVTYLNNILHYRNAWKLY